MNELTEIRDRLRSLQRQDGRRLRYRVPELWVREDFTRTSGVLEVNPFSFLADRIDSILAQPPEAPEPGEHGTWSDRAVVYNMMVRLTSAFDHDGDGQIAPDLNAAGFRETGTFLKSIAILPYIKRLGADTVHLLPVTAIGRDGRKGNLGSPYAIRDPFELDDRLSEPALGLGAEKELKAFVQAAHRLGLRVVVEFVFRTAAKDSAWAKEHPDWFYWIKESVPDRHAGEDGHAYGNPPFPPEQIAEIKRKSLAKDFADTIPPSETYRSFFTRPPKPEAVRKEGDRWVGTLDDGTRVRIPGAFADWPPDDVQPPWGDVTYLRMYDHPDFDYIAYNTIRMYDERLAREENAVRPLWETVEDIVPHYQRTFGIDGVMIDMGHALPLPLLQRMERKARAINPDFAFWEENFVAAEESREHGYNAVIGYVWIDQHHPEKMKSLLHRLSQERLPLRMFAAPESHNSPRAASRPGGLAHSRAAWAADAFLPLIPFLHSGFELGETNPVNTGLDFTPEQIRRHPAERLPLFSAAALDWTAETNLCAHIARVLHARRFYLETVIDADPGTVRTVETGRPHVLAFERHNCDHHLLAVWNADMKKSERIDLPLPEKRLDALEDLTAGKIWKPEGNRLKGDLGPGEIRIFEVTAPASSPWVGDTPPADRTA